MSFFRRSSSPAPQHAAKAHPVATDQPGRPAPRGDDFDSSEVESPDVQTPDVETLESDDNTSYEQSTLYEEPVVTFGAPVAYDPSAPSTLPVAHDETVAAHDPFDTEHTTEPFAQTVDAAEQAQAAAGVVGGVVAGVVSPSEWAGDGSTRQKFGHISGGIAPFVTTRAAFVRGHRAPALLVLEDGRTFRGEAYGAIGETHGEAVFNTGMTGYQETLTDPSYYGQVVAMTAPHIGNTGYNDEDPESSRIWVAGFVVRDPARLASNWRAGRTLEEELQSQAIVGISGIDTRALTRHLRERGAMRVGISSAELDPQSLLERVLASPGMSGADLAPHVSTKTAYVVPAQGERRYTVAALDLGIKAATPRYLSERGVEVHVLPSTSTGADLLALNPDGVFISNGPGDPAAMDYAVDALRTVLDADVPMFGICFGNQILGRAFGLSTYKLRYGHRGINQPVQDRATGRVHVTSHNHGFAVQADLDSPTDTPYGRVEVSHLGLNDNVVEGLSALDRPAFSVQYHPESAAGPHDAIGLFNRFTELMDSRR